MRFRFKNLLGYVVITQCFLVGSVSGESRINEELFRKAPIRERVAFAISCLENRELKLQNFDYDLHESITRVPNGRRDEEFVITNEISFKNMGSSNLINVRKLWQRQQYIELVASWDGSSSRARFEEPRKSHLSGSITDKESQSVADLYYNGILGFRVPILTDQDWSFVPLSVWLRTQADRADQGGTALNLDVHQIDGIRVLTIQLREGQSTKTVLNFDLNRDFMLIDEDLTRYDHRGQERGYRRSKVIEAQNFEGLWVPTDAIQKRCSEVRSGDCTEYHYNVSSFKLGQVKASDLFVSFPEGTHVVDSIQHKAYVIEANEIQRPIPLLDRNTDLVTIDGREQFRGAASPFVSRSTWLGSTIFLSVVAMVIAAGYFLVRHRHNKVPDGQARGG